MTIAIEPQPVRLAVDSDGQIRVGGTRVTLETVILAFQQGATPEEIIDQYPAIELLDAYSAIAYYLQHRAQVDAYLAEQHRLGEEVQAANEARFSPIGVRERLLARRATGSKQ
jgi:uncharacterized protein (DUF433 family)